MPVHDASRDHAHPCVQRAIAAELLDGVDELDEGQLAEVLAVDVSSTEQALDGAFHDAVGGVVQGCRRAGIARLERSEQLRVVQRRLWSDSRGGGALADYQSQMV